MSADIMRARARVMARYGFVTIPVFTNEDARKRTSGAVWAAMDEFPEYIVKGRRAQRVLGGFGALGNPSSFHHPVVQDLRAKVYSIVTRPLLAALATETGLPDTTRAEMLFDRLCIRARDFGSVSAEAWHRDIYDAAAHGGRPLPHSLRGGKQEDDIFGGWINLSDSNQRFVGIAGSHRDSAAAGMRGGGFAKEQAGTAPARLARQANQKIGTTRADSAGHLIIPAGHLVIFYQRLLHSVAGGAQPAEPQLRMFIGHRLTEEAMPLFDVDGVIRDGGVPRIPSGQIPPMYSQNHYAFFSTHEKYRGWGHKTFRPECLFERTTPSGVRYWTPGSRNDRDPHANRKRHMPALRDMGMAPFPYTDRTRSVFVPRLLSRKRPRNSMIR